MRGENQPGEYFQFILYFCLVAYLVLETGFLCVTLSVQDGLEISGFPACLLNVGIKGVHHYSPEISSLVMSVSQLHNRPGTVLGAHNPGHKRRLRPCLCSYDQSLSSSDSIK